MAKAVLLLAVITTLTTLSTATDSNNEDNQNLKSAVDKISQVLNSMQMNRRELNSEITKNNDDDVQSDDVSKRGGQILGIGGRCGWYNEKCSGFATHCCDPWRCEYKKWYHRVSKTGGRCM